MNHREAIEAAHQHFNALTLHEDEIEYVEGAVRAYLSARADEPDHIKDSATCGHIVEPAAELLLMDFGEAT